MKVSSGVLALGTLTDGISVAGVPGFTDLLLNKMHQCFLSLFLSGYMSSVA